jgi:uncharacterized protein (TIGR02391 family)
MTISTIVAEVPTSGQALHNIVNNILKPLLLLASLVPLGAFIFYIWKGGITHSAIGRYQTYRPKSTQISPALFWTDHLLACGQQTHPERCAWSDAYEEFPPVDAQTQSTGFDFFNDLDTDIRRVSQQLFKDGHYADSVSAAFKELNHQVKQEYKRRKNVELDGADLMHQAFSPKNPVFVLADQSNESGRNIQQGFMELVCWLNGWNPKSARSRESSFGSRWRERIPLFGQPVDEEIQDGNLRH